MKSWKTLSRETVLSYGKYLKIENHTIELPNGEIIQDWPLVITPDFINVLAQMEDGRFLIFRQTKYAVTGTSLAPVGGYIDAGEDPLTAAQRELREETGAAAAEWINLGAYRVGGNRGVCTGHFFLARGAHLVCERDADDLEEQEQLFLTRAELDAALEEGEFKVLSWAAVISLALLYLDRSKLS